MGIEDRLRRLEAKRTRVSIKLRNGEVRTFPLMEVLKALYLARYHAALGMDRPDSDVLDALEMATPASRRKVERAALTEHGTFYEDMTPLEPGTEIEDLSEQ